jgi:FMN phosphatase YigB (HAD superfamily)
VSIRNAPYRVLSLDLHDTVIWDTREIVEAQYEVRYRLLARGLRMQEGTPVRLEELRRVRDELQSEREREHRPVESIPVSTQVEQIRQRLGAVYADSADLVVERYAAGGLREHPPVFNPEAQSLVQYLNEVEFPVIMITDTSRSGSAWKSFLEGAGGIRLTHVIASTDVGACKPDRQIFTEAVKRSGVSPSEVLHVGDSWTWDVEGAHGFGMGAALYRGLWSHSWDPDASRLDPPPTVPPIPRLDHLSEVRDLLGLA